MASRRLIECRYGQRASQLTLLTTSFKCRVQGGHWPMSQTKGKEFLGALMVVVTSEGLVRVDDREGRSASGYCEGDSNKYEDFSHGVSSQNKVPRTVPHPRQGCDRNDKKLRSKFN